MHSCSTQDNPIFWTWAEQHGEYDTNSTAIVYQKKAAILKTANEAVMGHTLCSLVRHPEPNFEEGFFIYAGKNGLPPEKWPPRLRRNNK
jgi:hypothetical protein